MTNNIKNTHSVSASRKKGNKLKAFLFNKKTVLVIKLVIPLAILFYLFSALDVSLIKSYIFQTNPGIFLVSFIILCVRNLIGAYRSSVLLKYKGLQYPLTALTRYYFIGNFFNLFLPAVVGRDIARGYYLYNTSSGKKGTISSIFIERFIGTAALVLLSLFSVVIAMILGFEVFKNDVIRIIVVIFCLSLVLFLLFFYEKTNKLLESMLGFFALSKLKPIVAFIQDILNYNRSPAVLLNTFLSSMAFQLFGVISTYLIALSLNCSQPFIFFFILLPVIWLAGLLPISINGLGVREGSFVLLFRTTGMTEEMAMTIGILWSVQTIGLGLIGGVLFLLEGRGRTKSS